MVWRRLTSAEKEIQGDAAEQVARSHRYQSCTPNTTNHDLINTLHTVSQYLTEGLILQLRETVARQEMRIQMLEKQVRFFFFPQKPPVSVLVTCVCITACIPANSRSMSSGRRMKGSGQQSIVQHCIKQDVTTTETTTLLARPGMQEEGEARSQTTGGVLQGPACETSPADKKCPAF